MAKSKENIPWDELPEVMKPEQVQQKIQISRTTFFRLVQSGKLPGAKKVGDSWRIDRDQLRAYFDPSKDSGSDGISTAAEGVKNIVAITAEDVKKAAEDMAEGLRKVGLLKQKR